MLTSARGGIIQAVAYHPFGTVRHRTGDSPDPFAFVSNELDPGSGLADFKARPYRADASIFLSPDPVAVFKAQSVLATPAALASHGYSRADPVNLADQDGQYARISRPGNQVRITVPIVVDNNSSMPDDAAWKYATDLATRAAATWSGKFGKFQVSTTIVLMTRAHYQQCYQRTYGKSAGINVLSVYERRFPEESLASATMWSVQAEQPKASRSQLKKDGEITTDAIEEGRMTIDRRLTDKSVFAHELGHLLGLHHGSGLNDPSNIMTPDRLPDARANEAQIELMLRMHSNVPWGKH